MKRVKFEWGIEQIRARDIFGFVTLSPERFVRRSGGVSRARLKYRVLLANQRKDGSIYRLIRVRLP
jgi:hypothetical protein